MKNKKLIISFIVFSLSLMLSAQQVVDAFTSMKDEYYLSLPSAQRKEMVNAYYTDSVTARKNKFRGVSSITVIDTINQFISVQNSKNARVDLKVLQSQITNSVYYYALVFTACAPICDSYIGFYDTNWAFIKGTFMPKVKITNFFDTEKIIADGKTVSSIAEHFDIVFVELRFLDNGNNIEAVLNSGKYLDKENYTKLKKYLKGDKILYDWKNDTFVINKCYW